MQAVENELHAVMLDITDIVQSDVRIREVDETASEFPGLLRSITARGVLEPVSVRQVINPETGKVIPGKYELISGGHRKRCCEIAKIKQIPAIVFMDVTDDELVARQTISNMHRIKQKVSEVLFQIKLYSQRHQELTQEQVAAWFDMSGVKLGQMLKLNNLTNDSLALVDKGDITLSNSFQLARLAPEDQNKDVLDDAINMSIEDFSATVKRIKSDRLSEKRGLPHKEGLDPKLMKKSELEAFWQELVYSFESSDTNSDDYVFVSAQKLALDRVFQVDPESITRRQKEKDAKKAIRTLESQEAEITKKQAELKQLNEDLIAAKESKEKEPVGV